MSRPRTPAIAAVVLALVTACTTSTTGVDGPAPQNVAVNGPALTPDEMQTEFKNAQEDLDLPAGVNWPLKAPEAPPAPDIKGVMRGNSYEPGYGVALAEGFWLCIWEREWVQARTNSDEKADAALSELQEVKSLSIYAGENVIPSTREYLDRLLQGAAINDPTLIANDVELNCQVWF